MKQFFTFLLLIFAGFSFAQNVKLSGKISDEETGEALIGASVAVGTIGTVTDFDGNFSIDLPKPNSYVVKFSYVGYNNKELSYTINSDLQVSIQLKPIVLNEVLIVADIAKDRQTPVAFSNIPTLKIQEELASQDLPMILNSTPGTYATRTGGGDGDARITIRGFNQRNVAVMLDGIPVNDMENGAVFWSNWFGLDLVTQTMQVQRGLGSSKLSIPSVGGTINILTKGIDSKASYQLQQEIGNNGYVRTTFGVNTGRLKHGWGISLAGSYKQTEGYVDANYSKGYFYYLRIDKQFKKHLITLSGFGAPQEHGQRSFMTSISTIDVAKAKSLGISDEVINNPGNILGVDRGLSYNQHWGYLNGEKLNSTINYYHKPQFSLRHSWQPNEKFFWSNVAYLSVGNGGGTGFMGDSFTGAYYNADGQIDMDTIAALNAKASFGKPAGKSNRILRSSFNNHFWYGVLSTVKYDIDKNFTFSGGLDARYYRGDHYREVYDLLGGEYFIWKGNSNIKNETTKLYKGDKLDYNYSGFVRWGGLFGLLEYKKDKISAFVNISGALTQYRMEDYFKSKILTLGDTTFLVSFSNPVTYNGNTYTINSPEAKTQTLDWVTIPTFTYKMGASYNIDDLQSAFVNTGYIDKAQRFNNVLYQNRTGNKIALANNYENEKIYAVELGYSFRSSSFSGNLNAYYTYWLNKPLDSPIALRDPNDPLEVIPLNIPGIDALHRGAELDFAYKMNKKLTFEGLISIGNWKWNSSESVNVSYRDTTYNYSFNAKGVHVGDAAQIQYGAMVRYEPIKSLYFKARGTFFGKNYSNFNPESLQGANGGKDSWQLPNYFLLDFNSGYTFDVKKTKITIRANILNVLDTKYISDAQNNDTRAPGVTTESFNAASASVYFGLGRQWNLSLLIGI